MNYVSSAHIVFVGTKIKVLGQQSTDNLRGIIDHGHNTLIIEPGGSDYTNGANNTLLSVLVRSHNHRRTGK